MAQKRITLMDDVERLAETVWNQPGIDVKDFDTFSMKWQQYMGDLNQNQQRQLRLKVFDALRKDHPDVTPIRKNELFTAAGGRNLRKDKLKNANLVTSSKDEYLRRGATRVDLSGLDTKGGKKIRPRRPIKDFKVAGRQKQRVVFSRRDVIVKAGRKRTVFRDRLGRFVSPTNKKPKRIR